MNVYKIYEEYKRKQVDTLPELCDIFEFLALFYKDLDKNFKVLVDELGLIKTDFANIKKAFRIRWMNDVEQKGADIRELLLADSAAPFVDLSKEQPADVDRL